MMTTDTVLTNRYQIEELLSQKLDDELFWRKISNLKCQLSLNCCDLEMALNGTI